MTIEHRAIDRGDDFYRSIAEWVRRFPRRRGRNTHLAALYGVPVTTAERWVKEARRRGLLSAEGDHPCHRCGLPRGQHNYEAADGRDECIRLLLDRNVRTP